MEAIHENSRSSHLPELGSRWTVPPSQTDIIRTYLELVEAKDGLDTSNVARLY